MKNEENGSTEKSKKNGQNSAENAKKHTSRPDYRKNYKRHASKEKLSKEKTAKEKVSKEKTTVTQEVPVKVTGRKGRKEASKLKIIPLGGLEQIGLNITVFEYENSIVVVDCGLSFPEDDMLGIDLVIPDITYLKENL